MVSVVVNDPFPGLALDDIVPIAARARALFARSKQHPVVQNHFWNLWGAVDMLEGLEHHHGNFVCLFDQLSEAESMINFSPLGDEFRRGLRHEVIAYLNRVGQFCCFANSKFVKQRVQSVRNLIPAILKFTPFRNKHGAHRSIDDPRKDDDEYVQQLQAWQLSSFGPLPFIAKVQGKRPPDRFWALNTNPIWKEHFVGIQMLIAKPDKFENFYLEREHPVISLEAFNVLAEILK